MSACCESHVPAPPGMEEPVYDAPWLGPGRRIASCCDSEDCGPCCAACPTCPTGIAAADAFLQAGFAALRAQPVRPIDVESFLAETGAPPDAAKVLARPPPPPAVARPPEENRMNAPNGRPVLRHAAYAGRRLPAWWPVLAAAVLVVAGPVAAVLLWVGGVTSGPPPPVSQPAGGTASTTSFPPAPPSHYGMEVQEDGPHSTRAARTGCTP